MMPYRELIQDVSQSAGIQNQIFATRVGGGFTVHVILEHTVGKRYWDLKDMGFKFKSVESRNRIYLHGVRARKKMSMVGIPVRGISEVQTELQHQTDRLRFPLSHRSLEAEIEISEKIAAIYDLIPKDKNNL